MIRNLIFDMGNVLSVYNPKKYMRKITGNREAAAAVVRELFEGPEWKLLDAGAITEEEAVRKVQKRIPEYATEVRRAVAEWPSHFEATPGMEKTVGRLKAKGYGLYLLSNAGLSFYAYCGKERIFRYFDGIVISAREHLVKPDPALYRRLLGRYGLKAEECLFIDDLEENVDGARRLGIRGVRFQGTRDLVRYLEKTGIL